MSVRVCQCARVQAYAYGCAIYVRACVCSASYSSGYPNAAAHVTSAKTDWIFRLDFSRNRKSAVAAWWILKNDRQKGTIVRIWHTWSHALCVCVRACVWRVCVVCARWVYARAIAHSQFTVTNILTYICTHARIHTTHKQHRKHTSGLRARWEVQKQ